MSKIIGVDTSSIDNVSGFFVTQGGGISSVPATTDSGILLCPQNSNMARPWSAATFEEYANPVHMFQISDLTNVKMMSYNTYNISILLNDGNLYIGGYTNNAQMGLSYADSVDAIDNATFKLALTNVKTAKCINSGHVAIKNDGTFWWTGSMSAYMNSTGVGGGNTYEYYSWRQLGSDTDWHDVDAYAEYPYNMVAIKGSPGSRYLYSTGYGQSYSNGQGNTTRLYSFTRVKSAANTDLTESFDKVKVSYSSNLAVSESGKLFSWGENARGSLGSGNTTDKQYATQVGTDTDWDDCWVQRYAGFAKKTDGTMYMSTGNSSWRIEPSTSSTFTQIGTDTDYEDLAIFDGDSSSHGYTVFAKKNGSWYVSTQSVDAGGWAGPAYQGSTADGSWVAVNTILQQNDITGTIDSILCLESSLNQGQSVIMFAVS